MHSKAPWSVITEASGTIWIAGHANQSSDDRYSEIAIIQTRGAASRDAHDNARLIASAPKLLEACREVERALSHLAWHDSELRIVERLRAAIKAASQE